MPSFGSSKHTSPLTLVFAAKETGLVARGLRDFQALEDEPFSFALPESAFEKLDTPDGEGNDLVYSAELGDGCTLPHWLKFDARQRTFSGTPGCDHIGALSIIVTASDREGASVSSRFVLSIAGTESISGDVNSGVQAGITDPPR